MGGWVGGRPVPIAESCHFVVELARLQDFKQGLNSQVGPSVAICQKNLNTEVGNCLMDGDSGFYDRGDRPLWGKKGLIEG